MKIKELLLFLACFFCLYCKITGQDNLSEKIIIKHVIQKNQQAAFDLTAGTANAYAFKLLKANQLQLTDFDIIYNLDEKVIKCIFEYQYFKEGQEMYLSLGVSTVNKNQLVENFYFGKSIEKVWKEKLKASETGFLIQCNLGLFLKAGENDYIKYPENSHFDKSTLLKNESGYLNKNISKIEGPVEFKQVLVSDSVEVIVPGVPCYIWYLNCALTSYTMLIAYWNDKGYNTMIPGGNNVTGHYWAITEELCFLGESPDINIGPLRYYPQDHELGNNYQFRDSSYIKSNYSINGFWDLYVKLIDSTGNPLGITWNGAPYGAHMTVGIGYKIIDGKRYIITNDTWREIPYYIDYDEYSESINSIDYFRPASKTSKKAILTEPHETVQGEPLFFLDTIKFNILPSLKPSVFAYHSFELADLNNDKKDDLIVCNFMNNTGINGMKVYYNDGSTYNEDQNFRPANEWFECPNITRTFDFDNDGDLDIATTGYWAPVVIYSNAVDSIKKNPVVIDNQGRGFIDLAYGDYNHDGYIDLIASSVNGQIRIYQNNNGSFISPYILDPGSQSYKLKLMDLNNDNYPDLIASSRNGTIKIYYNYGGQFHATPDFSPIGHGGLSFDVADLDNDGWPDIVTSSDGKILIYTNHNGQFTDNPTHVNDDLDCFPKDIVITDLNSDQYPEIMLANYNSANIVLLNDQGRIIPSPVWNASKINPSINLRVFDDINGEKKILTGISRGGDLAFYKGKFKICNGIDTTIENVSILNGESYNGWTKAGKYCRTLKSVTSCDSVIITNLKVNIWSVSAETINLNSIAGSNGNFDINSNLKWSIDCDQPWISLSKNSGENNANVIVTADENNSLSNRSATITVSSTGMESQKIIINQIGRSSLIVCPPVISLEDANNSTAYFEIISNISWNISSDQDWLTLNKLSGTGCDTITIIATGNSTSVPRSATITISGSNSVSKTIHITQAASGLVLAGTLAYYPLSVNGNDSLGQYTPMLFSNITYQNGGIYCNGIINDSKAITPPINLSDLDSFTISTDFLVTEFLNQPVFVCGIGCRWLGFYLMSSGKVELLYNNSNYEPTELAYSLNTWHNAKIYYNGKTINMYLDGVLAISICQKVDYAICGKNDTQITTKNYSNGQSLKGFIKNLRITQGYEINQLDVSKYILYLSAQDNVSDIFEISVQNTYWTISSDKNWLSFDKKSGTTNAKIKVTAAENVGSQSRYANIYVSGSGAVAKIISVIQEGVSDYLMLSEDSIHIKSDGTPECSIVLTSNISWNIINNNDWITIEKLSGSNNDTLKIITSPNQSKNSRSANLIITGINISNKYINVYQDGSPVFLTVSTDSIHIRAAGNIHRTIELLTNTDWNITSNQSWLTSDPVNGVNNASITLTASDNPANSVRIADLTIAADGIAHKIIKVYQEAGTTDIGSINLPDFQIYPVPMKNKLIIVYTSPDDQTILSLYSPSGINVYTSKITKNITQVDVSHLIPGIYSIQIQKSGKILISKKILKL